MTTPIPESLAPFLQEYNLAQLNPQTAAPLLIERALQYGNLAELRWLFAQYPARANRRMGQTLWQGQASASAH